MLPHVTPKSCNFPNVKKTLSKGHVRSVSDSKLVFSSTGYGGYGVTPKKANKTSYFLNLPKFYSKGPLKSSMSDLMKISTFMATSNAGKWTNYQKLADNRMEKISDFTTPKNMRRSTKQLNSIVSNKHQNESELNQEKQHKRLLSLNLRSLMDFGELYPEALIAAAASCSGRIYGVNKVNHDTTLVLQSVIEGNTFGLVTIFDGHGPEGHKVSHFLSFRMKSKIIDYQRLFN